jgi:hypothetical protein
MSPKSVSGQCDERALLRAFCPVQLGYDVARLEKSRNRLKSNVINPAGLSCLIVTGTVMLTLFSPSNRSPFSV